MGLVPKLNKNPAPMNESQEINTSKVFFFFHEVLCSSMWLRSLNNKYSLKNQGVNRFKREEIIFNLHRMMADFHEQAFEESILFLLSSK